MFGGPSGRIQVPNQMHFATVPASHMPRSAFDRSHTHKTTGQLGTLIPYFCDEILPGDTVKFQSTIFARLLTPIVPAMDNLEVKTEYFFVPNRLVWTNWVKMMGEQNSPSDSISYTIPQMAQTTWAVMTIADYLGCRTDKNVGGASGYLSALPFRCYNKIWFDWYKDENIQAITIAPINTGDGPDAVADYSLLKRAKKHDYFYSALTAVQKGTAVPLLSGTANVYGTVQDAAGKGTVFQHWNVTDTAVQFGGVQKNAADLGLRAPFTGTDAGDNAGALALGTAAQYTSMGAGFKAPYADFTTDAIDTINTLRLAATTQQFLEKDARAGTRYTEICLSHFGVTNPDARLQRSEYLGGGSAPITITPIPATGFTAGANHTGDLGAIATGMSNNHGFTKSFTEHGHILGFVTVRVAALTYQQGLHKMWTRQTRYDHYFPVFANLGEQAVQQSEIYYLGDKAGANLDAGTWGYQERWAEYRYMPNRISGLFRSTAASTLDIWHYAQNYATSPALNSTFLLDDSQTIVDRNLAVTTSAIVAALKFDIYNKYHHARVMPVRSVPGIARL